MRTVGPNIATSKFPVQHVKKRAVGPSGIAEIEHYTSLVGLTVQTKNADFPYEEGDIVYVLAADARQPWAETVFRLPGSEAEFLLVPAERIKMFDRPSQSLPPGY